MAVLDQDAWEAFGSDSDDEDDDNHEEDINNKQGVNNSGNPPNRTEMNDSTAAAEAVALFLAQSLLKLGGSAVPLSERNVAIWSMSSTDSSSSSASTSQSLLTSTDLEIPSAWKVAIEARGIHVVTDKCNDNDTSIYDVVLGISNDDTITDDDDDDDAKGQVQPPVPKEFMQRAWRSLVPGGSLLMAVGLGDRATATTSTPNSMSNLLNLDASFWINGNGDAADPEQGMLEQIYNGPSATAAKTKTTVFKITKLPCRIQEATCPWLSNSHDLHLERQRVAQATVTLSSSEIRSHQLTDATVRQAVKVLQQTGFCIVPQLLDPVVSLQWGDAVLQDFHVAAKILLRNEQVDLYHPGDSAKEPGTYRELSMREDLRLDLRSGPQLQKLRGTTGEQGNKPWTVRADTPLDSSTEFLRGHADLLEIIRRTMHPVDVTLSPGNFGRYNFDGRGPDGSFPDVRVGPVGGILSLPSSADQAMHADTPHLFEHLASLPAHYINMFTPGSASGDHVGQTALVPRSHRLDVTAEYAKEPDTSRPSWWKDLVRPRLELGDVLLFDCRILHFGLANTSSNVERPLLYTNVTQHWFHDPKNWDDQRPIFPNNEDD